MAEFLVCKCVRYLALEGMCLLATSEFSHDTVKKHQETIINALKVCPSDLPCDLTPCGDFTLLVCIRPVITERWYVGGGDLTGALHVLKEFWLSPLPLPHPSLYGIV